MNDKLFLRPNDTYVEYERLRFAVSNFFRFFLIVLVTNDEHGVNIKIFVVLESNSSY
jgi:hypothetical protein